MPPVGLDMAPPAPGLDVLQVKGSAALVEGLDVVGFQAAGTAALNAAPAVAG